MIKIIDYKKQIEHDMLPEEKYTQDVLKETIKKIEFTFNETIEWLMIEPIEFFRFGYHLKIK